MRHLLARSALLVLVTAAVIAFLLIPAGTPVPSSANPIVQYYLDIDVPIVPKVGWGIPPDGSSWHELYPAFCASHVQTHYEDMDHNGAISVCDNIIEAGAAWHVDQVMTTYFMSPALPGSLPIACEAPVTGTQNPVCETWHEIYPDFCVPHHIDAWEDTNLDGVVNACDNVLQGGQWWHIDRVGCDVIVSPNPVTETRSGSWGWLKNLFR